MVGWFVDLAVLPVGFRRCEKISQFLFFTIAHLPPPHATSIFMQTKINASSVSLGGSGQAEPLLTVTSLRPGATDSISPTASADAEGKSAPVRPRFILLGGFLGAGKTTCLMRLVEWLEARKLRVGVVTNDQADRLVDTAVALDGMAQGRVRQISGGCFCCKADDLVTQLQGLRETMQPDVLVAEPVGSCTDLMATVVLPLRQIYQLDMVLAPMSVVVDAARMYAGWFPRKGKAATEFSADVDYIFLKQLEEAECVLMNKVDLLTASQRAKLLGRLRPYTRKPFIEISTETGEGLEEWFTLLMTGESAPTRLMEMDYERYATGEALMGWYNAALSLHSMAQPVDGNKLLKTLAGDILQELEAEGIQVAHFKMSLKTLELPKVPELPEVPEVPRAAGGKGVKSSAKKSAAGVGMSGEDGGVARVGSGVLGVVNVVRNGQKPVLSRQLADPVVAGEFLVTLRAEGAPERLEAIVGKHLNKARREVRFVWREQCAFRPGRPVPVHRVTELVGGEVDGVAAAARARARAGAGAGAARAVVG